MQQSLRWSDPCPLLEPHFPCLFHFVRTKLRSASLACQVGEHLCVPMFPRSGIPLSLVNLPASKFQFRHCLPLNTVQTSLGSLASPCLPTWFGFLCQLYILLICASQRIVAWLLVGPLLTTLCFLTLAPCLTHSRARGMFDGWSVCTQTCYKCCSLHEINLNNK